jgi:predicted RecA/RadA family phage recombinase
VDAAIHIYQGTMVFFERTSGSSEGYGTDTDDGGANNFAGIAVDECDNSAGAAGAKSVEVFTEGTFELKGTGFSQAIVGDLAYAGDNYTVTATSGGMSKIGRFVEYVSTTKMGVKIDVPQA